MYATLYADPSARLAILATGETYEAAIAAAVQDDGYDASEYVAMPVTARMAALLADGTPKSWEQRDGVLDLTDADARELAIDHCIERLRGLDREELLGMLSPTGELTVSFLAEDDDGDQVWQYSAGPDVQGTDAAFKVDRSGDVLAQIEKAIRIYADDSWDVDIEYTLLARDAA